MKKKIRRFESGLNTAFIEYWIENSKFFGMDKMDKKDFPFDFYGDRYLYDFKNGYKLSVIRYSGAYCDINLLERNKPTYKKKEDRLYEIGVIYCGDIVSVRGYLSYKDVNVIMEEMKKRKQERDKMKKEIFEKNLKDATKEGK